MYLRSSSSRQSQSLKVSGEWPEVQIGIASAVEALIQNMNAIGTMYRSKDESYSWIIPDFLFCESQKVTLMFPAGANQLLALTLALS
jgi:hypothetical protein